MHGSSWPPLYQHPLPILQPDGQTVVEQPCEFLLPHEVLAKLFAVGNSQVPVSNAGPDDPPKLKLASICEEWGAHDVVALSLWGDGVPSNWDRSESIFIYSWGLPALSSEEHRGLRVPVTALPKEMCCGATHNRILELIGWSLEHMALGVNPSHRPALGLPEGQEFQCKWRKTAAGTPLPYRAVLLHLKGDWEFFGNIIHLPRWDNVAGVCYLCKIKKADVGECGLKAPYRQPDQRIPPSDLLEELAVNQLRPVSPVWGFPSFDGSCIQLDWLHCADQGVKSTFLAILSELVGLGGAGVGYMHEVSGLSCVSGVTATMEGSILVLLVAEPGLRELGRTINARRLSIWSKITLKSTSW